MNENTKPSTYQDIRCFRLEPRYAVGLLDQVQKQNLSLLVMKEGTEKFRSAQSGIVPLLELAEHFPEGLASFTVVDTTVGACAARVFVHLKAGEVIAHTFSQTALAVLTLSATPHAFVQLVREIRSQSGSGMCPFEQLSMKHADTAKLISAMRSTLEQLRNN